VSLLKPTKKTIGQVVNWLAAQCCDVWPNLEIDGWDPFQYCPVIWDSRLIYGDEAFEWFPRVDVGEFEQPRPRGELGIDFKKEFEQVVTDSFLASLRIADEAQRNVLGADSTVKDGCSTGIFRTAASDKPCGESLRSVSYFLRQQATGTR